MDWDNERARQECAWLSLMSRLKYDYYQDFLAGVRFIESMADWLQQFPQSERQAAYDFVRYHLVYVGQAEMHHLVSLVYPETVQRRLMAAVAAKYAVPEYRVWSDPATAEAYRRLRRKTLFVALSDGARIDVFRRANAGTISNEQVVIAPQIADTKWDGLLHDLRRELQDESERFSFVWLLDDFAASGTTLLRHDDEENKWKGKLVRFWNDLRDLRCTHFEDEWVLCVHHYIASDRASRAIVETHERIVGERKDGEWFRRVEFSFGIVLPKDLPLDANRHQDFLALIERYYDPALETVHTNVGGGDVRLGFSQCALPLVLEHNTPNNAPAILWAETEGAGGQHAMRPLFRRRQRHS